MTMNICCGIRWLLALALSLGLSGCVSAAPEAAVQCDLRELNLSASVVEDRIQFTLENRTDETLEVVRGFAHWQNMYLVFVRDYPFGKIVPRTREAGDPPAGEYVLKPGERVQEFRRPVDEYRQLAEVAGRALAMFSTRVIFYRGERMEERTLCGSIVVALPFKQN